MKTQKSAMKNVLSKLSAMRVTLSTEEQKILDSLIMTSYMPTDEVVAHAAQAKVATSKVASAITTDEDEVMAHAMQSKVATSKVTPAITTDDEVVAHAAQSKVATSRVASIHIAFNAETGQYVEE